MLFSENVCENKRIGSHRGACARHAPRSANETVRRNESSPYVQLWIITKTTCRPVYIIAAKCEMSVRVCIHIAVDWMVCRLRGRANTGVCLHFIIAMCLTCPKDRTLLFY